MFFQTFTEKFFSLNILQSPIVGGFSLVPLLGIVFIVLLVLIFFIADDSVNFFKKNSFKDIFLYLAFIFWLPISGIYIWINSANAIKDLAIDNLDVRREALLCRIDENQGLQTTICGVAKLVNAIKKTVPDGSSYCLITNGTSRLYIGYELYGLYKLEDCKRAQYIFTYMPDVKLEYSKEHLIFYFKENKPEDFGLFNGYTDNNDLGSFIFKRK